MEKGAVLPTLRWQKPSTCLSTRMGRGRKDCISKSPMFPSSLPTVLLLFIFSSQFFRRGPSHIMSLCALNG